MIKRIAIATMVLIPVSMPALAQTDNPPSAPQGTRAPGVIGQTGTMYDGNNTNLQLPAEQNAYWAHLWAQPAGSTNSGVTPAVGVGAAGTSLGGTTGGGER